MLDKVMAFIFPDITKCIICGEETQSQISLCSDCEKNISYYKGETTCQNCGRFYHGPACNGVKLDGIVAVARYMGEWKEVIHKFKFNNHKYLGKGLAKKLKERLDDTQNEIDTITYVPATTKTLKERGFDQSQLLAKELGKLLGVKVIPTLKKQGKRLPQHTLSLQQRKENWEEEFLILPNLNLEGKSILLLDDIYTTGYTLHHATKALKKTKCKHINIAVLAN